MRLVQMQSVNPANLSDIVTTIDLATADDIVAAARSASAAQRAWAGIPAPARGRVIASVGRLVEANKESLAALVTREIGKPYAEALGEVQEVIDTCDFFLGEGRRLYGQTVPSELPAKQLFTHRMPVGTALIITAGNFPTAVPSWYLVPALLCGNTVVWKPGEVSAAIATALTALFHAGGVPKDVLVTVVADGATTFEGLERALDQGLVQKVGFTGSTAVGRRIGELCGRHLQTPCLELGGKNPMVVMPDADLDLAVEGALFGGFGAAGQRCTSLGTLWVHDDVYDEMRSRFVAAVEAAVVGDPTKDVLFGPLISPTYLENHERNLGLVASHQSVHGSTGTGQIPERASVVVIGGGVVGCSTAFHLAEAGVDVLLVERDSLGSGSSSKAAGGVRACFSDPVNVALGKRSLALLADVGTRPGGEIDLHKVGYLFLLTTADQVTDFSGAVEVQNSLGVTSRIIGADEAHRISPLANVDDVIAACWSPDDGTVTPEAVVQAYAAGARRHGARLVTGAEVVGAEVVDGEVRGVTLRHNGSEHYVATGTVIVAAGAWSASVGELLGFDLPVQPLRREIVVTGPMCRTTPPWRA